MKTIEVIFWCLAALVFYTYLGYGIVLYILMRCKEHWRRPTPLPEVKEEDWPHVTLFITAYNEEDIVEEKMCNCHALLYPKDRLHILWVTDGTTDSTNQRLAQYPDVTVTYSPERRGKTAAMNRGIQEVTTPYTVFTDANTMLNPEAIRELILRFQRSKVGCVAGEKRIMVADKSRVSSSGEGIYWKYESTLKRWDARLHTAVGAAGELFAIRTELYEQMPEDTLLDDFVLSLRICMRGYVTDYCSTAYAMETASANMREEEKRKVRISAGGLQSIYRLSSLLNPLRYGILTFQYVSHRVLRWSVTPLALFTLAPLNFVLCFQPHWQLVYVLLLLLQGSFYVSGFVGRHLAEHSSTHKKSFVPYYFLFMNVNVLRGALYLKRKGQNDGTWEKAKRASHTSPRNEEERRQTEAD
jgi:cellulose synthase/poly-beta-1,6-N-acetylglucosamine synthase-like glycosyltransferase